MTLPAASGAAAAEASAAPAEATPAEAAPESPAESAAEAAPAARARLARPAAAAAEAPEERHEKAADGRERRERDRIARHEGQEPRPGAREERPHGASENAAQHHRARKHREQDQRQDSAADAPMSAGLPLLLGRRERLTLDELDHLVEGGVDAGVVVALAEGRAQRLGNDAVAHGVGQDALEPVTDLNEELSVILGDDQQRTV